MQDKCYVCGSEKLTELLNLGKQPLANDFQNDSEDSLLAESFELVLVLCENCSYVFLRQTVDPKRIFAENIYLTGISKQTQNDMQNFATSCINHFGLTHGSKVLDIASNDGTLLSIFKSMNFNTIGVDASINASKVAKEKGIETINSFFDKGVALQIKKRFGKIDLITMTNLITHVTNPIEILTSAKEILTENGHIALEFYYFDSLVSNIAFDQIYHEHISYFNMKSLNLLLKKCGLKIDYVEIVGSQGGSIRCFLSSDDGGTELPTSVQMLLEREGTVLDTINRYRLFANAVIRKRVELIDFFKSNQNVNIVGYGASAKTTVLLNYLRLGVGVIKFVADKNPLKLNKYIPGTDIKIINPEQLKDIKPTFIIIFAWNLAQEIIAYLKEILPYSAKYVLLTPIMKVMD